MYSSLDIVPGLKTEGSQIRFYSYWRANADSVRRCGRDVCRFPDSWADIDSLVFPRVNLLTIGLALGETPISRIPPWV